MQLVPIKNILPYSHNKWDKHLISSKKDLSQVPMFVSQNGSMFDTLPEELEATLLEGKFQNIIFDGRSFQRQLYLHCISGAQVLLEVFLFSGILSKSRPGFFLTPAAKKTKTQAENSSQKLKEKTQPPGGFSLQLGKLKKKT